VNQDDAVTALDVDLSVRRGALDLAVQVRVEPGEVVAVLGPNGAGKSTLLGCVAGLLPIDGGRVAIGDAVVDEPAAGTFVPAERRPIGVVFQDYLLFAHLSVLENVAFGLRARGVPAAEARRRVGPWLERLGLADLAGHRPATLSGGQAQRVALARALAPDPAVLLLDEPLAALDATTRGEVRRDLRRHLDSFAGVRLLVTHDPVDAYALADRVIVLEDGRITQTGSLATVTARPATPYVAQLVGLNLVAGALHDRVLMTAGGASVVAADAAADGPAFAAVRPQAVALHRRRPDGSARNVWALTVAHVDVQHDRARVSLVGALPLVAEITPEALADLELHPGDEVWASVKATEVTVYAR
jgi:molybdate transport system ATP-binding protein